jgi:hypothetical protein
MALPDLRHFTPTTISSDPVEALIDGAWVTAIYTDQGWTTADGGKLSADITEWRHAAQEGEVPECSLSQHQGRDESGQAAKASHNNRPRKSR